MNVLVRTSHANATQFITEAVNEYRQSQNAVGLWLEECTLTGDKRPTDAWTPAAVAYQDYSRWCAESRRIPKNFQNFGADVARLVERKKSNGVKYALALLCKAPTDADGALKYGGGTVRRGETTY